VHVRAIIVYDNTTTRNDLIADWGFACYIEVGNKKILFDTGGKGDILLHNMKTLGIAPSVITEIFISHNHFDHIGGLSAFLDENSDVILYVPHSVRGVYHASNVVHIDKARRLDENIYTTGELQYIEQSLVIQTEKGLVLLVGCSHPHMVGILHAAQQFGTVYAIIGGLHGFNYYDLFQDLTLICPTHCTQHKKELKLRYPEKYEEGGVGTVIEI
jgi:7,8-dihydropterin-6-yl-methyl-4-(beta-D-ribofuranosyl)aminobenzene 5'-phosphate synthase